MKSSGEKKMMDRLNTITRCLPAVMASIFFMTGCQSTRIVRMYNGPDVPADQLATLVAPWCISLRSVDGVPAPSTLADELRLLLKPGVHTVEARYVVLYPTGKSDTEKIVSDYITLTFTGEAGKIYTICSKDPKTLEATRKYAAHVSLWIEENRAGAAKGSAMEKPTAPVAMPTGAK